MKISPITRLLLLGLLLWILSVGFQMMPAGMMPGLSASARDFLHGALTTPYFTVGDVEITPLFLLKSLLFLLALSVFSGMVRRFLRDRVLTRTSMDQGQRYAAARVTGYAVFFIGVIVGLQSAGVNLSSLLVVGGAVGIGVGFGLQTIANNFISGLILLFERPVKIGDRVEVGSLNGDVIRIAGRSTWVRTNDNIVVIVPNAEFIANQVTNWTANDPQVRFSLPVGVSYGSDPEKVRRVLLDVAAKNPDVMDTPEPSALFTGFGDSALHFELRVWTVKKTHRPKELLSDLNYAIFAAFREQGIQIPFPQRDLHIKSFEVPVRVAQ